MVASVLPTVAAAPTIRFEPARVDVGPGGDLAQAMRDEIAVMYDGLELDGDYMPGPGTPSSVLRAAC